MLFNSLAVPPPNATNEKTLTVAYNRNDKEMSGDMTDVIFTAFDSTGKQNLTFTESDVEDLKREDIIEIQVGPETGLIHVLDTNGHVYIVNHEIKRQNNKGGLIFTLDLKLASTPRKFFLPSNLQGKLQLPLIGSVLTPSGHKLGAKAEQFRIKNNLKPRDFLLGISSQEV